MATQNQLLYQTNYHLLSYIINYYGSLGPIYIQTNLQLLKSITHFLYEQLDYTKVYIPLVGKCHLIGLTFKKS